MGFNSTVLILNDQLGDIERNPKDFVRAMCEHIHSHGYEEAQCFWPGQAEVMTCDHADVVNIIAVGGNCATVLGKVFNGGHHHTKEDQISLLRELADQYGFGLRKKPQKG